MKAYFDHTCVRCGKSEPEVKIVKDHIVPIYQGGSDGLDNLQPALQALQFEQGAREQGLAVRAGRRLRPLRAEP